MRIAGKLFLMAQEQNGQIDLKNAQYTRLENELQAYSDPSKTGLHLVMITPFS